MADDNIPSLLDIAGLIYRRRTGSLSPAEQSALETWMVADPANRALVDQLSRQDWIEESLKDLDPVALQASVARVYKALGMKTTTLRPVGRAGRIRLLSINRRFAAAAILILVAATGAYWGFFRKPRQVASPMATLVNDVPPPTGTKTTLTLAGGKTIILDSVQNGDLARQGNTQVAKLTDNQLTYQPSTEPPTAVVYNTLSTAKGGQTIVTLADGTKVWLNALSSLRYPTAFTASTRDVTLTGEAYFEVAHNAGGPFRVHAGRTTVEDIGTRFNVNAYADEPDLRTTLLQGAVRVDGRILAPGEQAAIDKTGQWHIQKDIDPDEVLAWKNGEFVFNRLDMASILRQVGRWYDVEIVDPGPVASRSFSGIISRKSNLSEVMKILERAGIRFRIEGKKMILFQ
ncbi:MAG TPA: FecR domain-containing protein [Puia sp.]|uniref:FecR family protein n=1 Tax=Puia sp. TaxID=2045100 RepID=UPI002B544796|nr:FecR domain-containing protein [Puia sp.]HVU94329.1 FecR domain-containing protein [Puia sp.]